MGAIRELRRATVAEYLAVDDASPVRHEFRDGVIYAMGGASDDHGRVTGNIFAAIHGALPPRCDVFMADMRLKVRAVSDDAYYYPDIMVTGSELDRARSHREHPKLVIEVLSPSSERIDRGEKFQVYTQLPSCEEYAIVAQSVPQIDLFRRREAWRGASYFLEDDIQFESIGLTLPVRQIYRRVSYLDTARD